MKPSQIQMSHDGTPVLPKAEAAVIDLLYAAEQERYKVQHVVERLKKIETACEDRLRDVIDLKERKGGSGRLARVEIEPVRVPQLQDFDKLWAHARKMDAPEFFHQRISSKAVEDRWAHGKTVPGVIGITVKKVHVHKLKRRGS